MTAQIKTPTLIDIIAVNDFVGEGIIWDSRRHVLWWTDIQRSRLYRYDWNTRTRQILDAPERIGAIGLIAGSEKLITAFASGLAIYDPYSKAVEWLARPALDMPSVRFNDARVDRSGRFWAGTMVEGENTLALGCLYSFDRRQGLRCHRVDVLISNGLCISPDGTQLYFADSMNHCIDVYDLNIVDGSLGMYKTFAHCTDGASPDGATIDSEGYMWSAHWNGSRVVRYAPDGHIDLTLAMPTCQPTCACFGGPELDLLFVTSARAGLNAATLQREPHAGDVFVYGTGYKGLPEAEYQL